MAEQPEAYMVAKFDPSHLTMAGPYEKKERFERKVRSSKMSVTWRAELTGG